MKKTKFRSKVWLLLYCFGLGCGVSPDTRTAGAGDGPKGSASNASGSAGSGQTSSETASASTASRSLSSSTGTEVPDASRSDAAIASDSGASEDASNDSFSHDASDDSSARDAAAPDASSNDGGDAGPQGPGSFHCVNWADQRDNFVQGLLQPSGLDSATDTYATVVAKANAILSAFETDLDANAIRIPINEPTVSGAWWSAYKGIIDAAVARGMKVVVAYWAYHNGKPDSVSAYDSMWRVVVDAYQQNPLVYFDIHNEPYGFSSASWLTFAESWLSTFPTVPKDHIIVAGTGYDQNVNPPGGDAKLDGTLLSLHVYTFFSSTTTTAKGWETDVQSNVGSYASRTIVTEWGSPMTTGTNYDATTDGDLYVSYMNGVPDQLRASAMGSCFWPGLRIGDAWSITTLHGTGSELTLSVTNASGLDRIHWAWGL